MHQLIQLWLILESVCICILFLMGLLDAAIHWLIEELWPRD